MVLSRTARRHRKADQQASLSTVVTHTLSLLPCPELLPISTSSQVIPPLEPLLAGLALQSIELNFLDADYGEQNSDDYEFRYPQDLDHPSDYMDNLSDDRSQGIAGQIESQPKTPDNTQLHKGHFRGPQIQFPGNSPPPSPSLSGSSDSVTKDLELVTAFCKNPAI